MPDLDSIGTRAQAALPEPSTTKRTVSFAQPVPVEALHPVSTTTVTEQALPLGADTNIVMQTLWASALASVVEPGSVAEPVEPVPEGDVFTLAQSRMMLMQQTGTRDHQAILAELENIMEHCRAPCLCKPELWQPWVAVRWSEYIGPGIARAYWQFRSIEDPERHKRMRLDLILVRTDGHLVLLHPGQKPRLSTTPEVVDSGSFVP